MFSLARRRREAERRKKLEEVFSKADSNGNGRITVEQMVKIFEENEVQGNTALDYLQSRFMGLVYAVKIQ